MGVNRNLAVKIPENATVCKDRVMITMPEHKYSDVQHRNVPVRHAIGIPHPLQEGMMYPNNTYLQLFPLEYEEQAQSKLPAGNLIVGLYAVIKIVSKKIGLYDILVRVLGEKRAHLMLDFAMYLLVSHSNVAMHYEARMSNFMLFSGKVYSDSTWSDFFSHITAAEIQAFKDLWIEKCKERGLTEGDISNDGSNDDCESECIEEAAKGKAKSAKNHKIVGFMYAVCNIDATPMTWETYRGSYVDSSTFEGMMKYLILHGVRPKSLLLDRGFCNDKCLKLIESHKMNYVVKMVESTEGSKSMVKDHMSSIKFDVQARIPRTQLFGVSSPDKIKLFKEKKSIQGYVHLFFDWKNGGERAFALMDQFDLKKKELETAINKHNEELEASNKSTVEKAKPSTTQNTANSESCQSEEKSATTGDKEKNESGVEVDKKLKKILSVSTDKSGKQSLNIDWNEYQTEVHKKGFFSIATSHKLSAAEAYAAYQKRDAAEKVFATLKTQLGFNRFRAKLSAGLHGRSFVAFVAAILRNELRKAGEAEIVLKKRQYLNANQVIDELLLMKATIINGLYCLTNRTTANSSVLLQALAGAEASTMLDEAVQDVNRAKRLVRHRPNTQANKKPKTAAENIATKRPVGRPPKPKLTPENIVPKKRGRPSRPRSPFEVLINGLPKRHRGRPTKAEQKEREQVIEALRQSMQKTDFA